MDPISKAFVAALERFARTAAIPVVELSQGQRKDDVWRNYLERVRRREGVLFIGKAQEKAAGVPHRGRRNAKTATAYPWIVRSTAMVNHYYFYGVDRDFGPFFLKFCSLLPLQREAVHQRSRVAQAPAGAQRASPSRRSTTASSLCGPQRRRRSATSSSAEQDRRPAAQVAAPPAASLYGRDRAAGYRYDLSILQAEFSLTQVLDRPVTGRRLLRGSDPREPRHRPPRPGAA